MILYPYCRQIPFRGPSGGSFLGAPYRGILHTVEGYTFSPSTSQYYGHRNPPHLTLDYEEDEGIARMWQHYPFDRASRALENRPGGVQTNRQNAIQIEIVWKAAKINEMPAVMWEALHQLVGWCQQHLGIEPFCPEFGDQEQYGLKNTFEFDDEKWDAFNGWCGHQHVPENAHWDPGAITDENLTRMGLVRMPELFG